MCVWGKEQVRPGFGFLGVGELSDEHGNADGN